jgi:hypothetical protein
MRGYSGRLHRLTDRCSDVTRGLTRCACGDRSYEAERTRNRIAVE